MQKNFKFKTSSFPASQKGFTLFEVVVSIALFSVIIILVSSMYVMSQRSYNKNSNQAELSQNARVVFDRISRELRQSVKTITLLPPTDTDPINPPVNEILFQDGHDISRITYLKYYLDGTNLMRQHIAYSFDTAPDDYVYYDSLDLGGFPPDYIEIDNRIIGEYVNSLDLWGAGGMINFKLSFSKNQNFLTAESSVFSRNQ